MIDLVVQGVLVLAGLYLCAGAVFAAVFLARRITAVDHQVEGAPLRFRLLILPGLVALWPLLLRGPRVRGPSLERLRRRHGVFIVVVLVLVLGIAIPALILRPAAPVVTQLPNLK